MDTAQLKDLPSSDSFLALKTWLARLMLFHSLLWQLELECYFICGITWCLKSPSVCSWRLSRCSFTDCTVCLSLSNRLRQTSVPVA
jgi:hypothetical protein